MSAIAGFPFATEISEDGEALARNAVHHLLREVSGCSGRCSVALSGGSTPKRMYQLLAGEFSPQVPWERLHWFFGDDRFVSPEDAESNYRMARETLLENAPIPLENVHPIPTVDLSLDQAASRYESELRRFYGAFALNPGRPLFNVVLLGMGPDGHTASLFPGKPAAGVHDRWVVGVPEAGQPPYVPRISLTFPALASSRLTLFLVGGAGKLPMLQRIAGGDKVPAAMVTGPKVLWLLDKAAAGEAT